MNAYRLSGSAEADLLSIFARSLDDFGPMQAVRYRDELVARLHTLAVYPGLFRLRHEYEPPTRICPFKAHVIVYDETDEGILIVRIRHASENWLEDPRGGDNVSETP